MSILFLLLALFCFVIPTAAVRDALVNGVSIKWDRVAGTYAIAAAAIYWAWVFW